VNPQAQSWSADAEMQALAKLGAQYIERGYSFSIYPAPHMLPPFLGSYQPDAIAQKQGENIVIEVKHRPNPAIEISLSEIRRLFEGQDDWQFVVSYIGIDASQRISIPTSVKADILQNLEEVRRLLELGEGRAAFVMAWSLLEAALHLVEKDEYKRPRTPGTVVQSLAMLGLIEPSVEMRIRLLVDLRNRIVHGDLNAKPTNEDVVSILDSVEQALMVEH
jgi:hypothetical protein